VALLPRAQQLHRHRRPVLLELERPLARDRAFGRHAVHARVVEHLGRRVRARLLLVIHALPGVIEAARREREEGERSHVASIAMREMWRAPAPSSRSFARSACGVSTDSHHPDVVAVRTNGSCSNTGWCGVGMRQYQTIRLPRMVSDANSTISSNVTGT